MGTLTFLCPRTRAEIKTAIAPDQYGSAAIEWVRIGVRCPHCGAQHEFKIEDGHLVEAA